MLVDPLDKLEAAMVTPEETVAIELPAEVVIVIAKDPVSLILFGFLMFVNNTIFKAEAVVLEVDPLIFTTEVVFVVKLVPLAIIPSPLYDERLVVSMVISLGKVNSIIGLASTGKDKEKIILMLVKTLTVEVVKVHETPVIVAALGTLQEDVPLSMVPPSDARVLTIIPVTDAVDIGFVTPEIVKLKVPDLAAVKILVKVTN